MWKGEEAREREIESEREMRRGRERKRTYNGGKELSLQQVECRF